MRFCFTRPAALLAALLACAGALPLRASGEGDEIDAGVPWAVARRRHPHHCGEAEAARQDAALSEAMRRDWGHSGCPGGAWWGDVVEGGWRGAASPAGSDAEPEAMCEPFKEAARRAPRCSTSEAWSRRRGSAWHKI